MKKIIPCEKTTRNELRGEEDEVISGKKDYISSNLSDLCRCGVKPDHTVGYCRGVKEGERRGWW
jgi:hypothetical protein